MNTNNLLSQPLRPFLREGGFLRKTAGFTLMELLIVMVIIGILATIMSGSFIGSQQKSRDGSRKSDLKQIGIALEAYYNDKGQYPVTSSGDIAGCANETVCDWGGTFADENGTVYMVELPDDPRAADGERYYYDSDGTYYQLYARLENTLDRDVPKDGDDNPQVYSGTNCGDDTCNYGISSSNMTPTSGHALVTE